MKRKWMVSAFVGSAAALLIGGCATDKSVIAKAQDEHAQLEPAVINDPQVDAYMKQIGDRIVAAAKELDAQGVGPSAHKKGDTSWMFKDVQFHMVNSNTLNAFTTGGHHVYIYSELFTTAKTEDEFAAVCSHEFAHIYCRHVQQGMDRQYGVYATAAAAAVGGAALAGSGNYATGAEAGAGVGLAAGQFIGMGFTRKDEDQADQYGFQFYTHAGWDPNHFADFFKQMIAKGYDTTPELASDHPKLSARVENTARRVNELPPNADQWRRPDCISPKQFAALQAIVARDQAKAPKNQATQAAQLMLAAFPSCVAPVDQPSQKKARQTLSAASRR
ncbi:MAG: M48 family metalloprotease [Tepidisphaeraceae bacterium]